MSQKIVTVRDGNGFEVIANRDGLIGLAIVLLQLAMLSDEQAKTAANHYHYDPAMNNAEEGSIPLTILYKPDL